MSDLNDLNRPVTTDTEPNVLDTLRAHIIRAATWSGWSGTAGKVAGLMSGVTAAVSGGRSLRLYRRNDANTADEEVVSLPGVSIGGSALTAVESASTNYINSLDGDRNLNDVTPNLSPRGVFFRFANAAAVGAGGSYAGVMTYAPWDGTSSSTGDASYQMAFGSTAASGGGVPQLRLRKGIDSTWNSWVDVVTSANIGSMNAGTASRFLSNRTNWAGTGVEDSVVGQLAWKNYGNGHTIVDVSSGLSPAGGAVDKVNPDNPWNPTFPTLMGWNGSATYGIRVDSARVADRISGDVGMVAHFARLTPPAGWLKANGDLVSRSTYAALFAAIGETYGAGDGTTTFGLPDARGEFLRGWDDGRGVDAGRGLGSGQLDEIKSHTHGGVVGDGAIGNIPAGGSTVTPTGNKTIGATGGTETRPRNIALLVCIKY